LLERSGKNGPRLPGRSPKRTREQQTRGTREALMKGALRVVARHGYAKASVARITEAAGVAQGTFYSYFDTHQQLLSELLPSEGIQLLDWLGRAAHGTDDYFEHERRAFSAFFKYIKKHPHFLRVLTEAEIAAPESYAQHMSNIEDRYVGALRRAAERGQIERRDDKTFRVIAEVLAGARGHITFGLSEQSRQSGEQISPDAVVETFVKFLRYGFGIPASGGFKQATAIRPGKSRKPAPATQDTRGLLLRTAGLLVHRHGYQATTIARITDAAEVAVGTFYAHFPSRQHLLDEILDHMRHSLLTYIREYTRSSRSFIELEARGFQGFFEFLALHPEYIRIESEAAVWAKESYTRHFIDLENRYTAAMRRSKASGEITLYEESELPTLSYILMAARHYLSTRYALAKGNVRPLPAFAQSAYIDLVQRGLSAR